MDGITSSGTPLDQEDIFARLREVAREDLELTPPQLEGLSLDESLTDGLGLDSLRQVVLLARIEDLFGVEFGPEDQPRLAELQTVRDLVRLIAERADERPA